LRSSTPSGDAGDAVVPGFSAASPARGAGGALKFSTLAGPAAVEAFYDDAGISTVKH
jgi:hypothetical protein